MLSLGGSGRLWVRGQSCKLTGCVKVNHGESFPPEASGPRARGKDCHARWVAFAARPAQPAVPQAGGQAPPGRGRVRHPARRPGRHRPGARPAQLGRAQAGLRPKSEPESHALDQLHWVVSRFSGADAPGWTAPADDELREHFDDRFLAVLPARALVEQVSKMAADLRGGIRRPRAAPLRGLGRAGRPAVYRGGRRHAAAPAGRPAGVPVGDRITDPRVKAPPPAPHPR